MSRFSSGSSYRSAIAWQSTRALPPAAQRPRDSSPAHSRDCGGPSLGRCIGGRALSGIRATTSSASSQLASARLAWRREKAGICRSVARSGCWCAAKLGDRDVGQDLARRPVEPLGDLRRGRTRARRRTPDRDGCGPDECPRCAATGHVAARGVPRRRPPARRIPAVPSPLAGLDQLGREPVPQLDQQFDVEGGVGQPFLRQRPASTSPMRSAPSAAGRRTAPRSSCPAPRGDSRAAGRPVRCRTGSVGTSPTSYRQRQVLAGRVDDPLGVGDCSARVRRDRPVARTRWDRSDGCRIRRGAAGSDRRAGCTGSRAPARRRPRPAQFRRASAAMVCGKASGVLTIGGTPSAGSVSNSAS